MKKHIRLSIILLILLGLSLLHADVPAPVTRSPSVPYYMQSIQFQTLQTLVFSPQYAGMVQDSYADLLCNPAFICAQVKKSIYFDFNLGRGGTFTDPLSVEPSYYSNSYDVIPRWYSSTSINTMDATPHYNLAALIPLSSRLTLGLFNRALFDYGPFRSTVGYQDDRWNDLAASVKYFEGNYELQRLEIDDNQQTLFGMQNEAILGYALSDKLDIALRAGYHFYNRDGDLYDSKWGNYPHSSFADLNDEALEINGDHTETGLGLMFQLDEKTKIGLYGSMMNGTSTESTANLDTSDSWSERDVDTRYYDEDHYELTSSNEYDNDASQMRISLIFERILNDQLTFRSYFSIRQGEQDISAVKTSMDTTFGEYTYDYYRYSTDHFRKHTYDRGSESYLTGSGTDEINQWRWFASLFWTPDENWTAFGGIQIQHKKIDKDFEELSNYRTHSWNQYTLYESTTNEYLYKHDKVYAYDFKTRLWTFNFPIGIKAKLWNGLSLLVGTDAVMTLTDEKSNGRVLYPERITRRWEDRSRLVNDEEVNRYEEYHSTPAKEFNRTVYHHFGLMYEHPAGLNVFFRSSGEVLDTANWAMGFSLKW